MCACLVFQHRWSLIGIILVSDRVISDHLGFTPAIQVVYIYIYTAALFFCEVRTYCGLGDPVATQGRVSC